MFLRKVRIVDVPSFPIEREAQRSKANTPDRPAAISSCYTPSYHPTYLTIKDLSSPCLSQISHHLAALSLAKSAISLLSLQTWLPLLWMFAHCKLAPAALDVCADTLCRRSESTVTGIRHIGFSRTMFRARVAVDSDRRSQLKENIRHDRWLVIYSDAALTSTPCTGCPLLLSCGWIQSVITQLWMNLKWVNIWFHLGNQFCKK
jgi:hypothetical protein